MLGFLIRSIVCGIGIEIGRNIIKKHIGVEAKRRVKLTELAKRFNKDCFEKEEQKNRCDGCEMKNECESREK